MNRLFCKRTFGSLMTVSLCFLACAFSQDIAMAQIQTVGQARCSGDATPCTVTISQEGGVTSAGAPGPMVTNFQGGVDVEVVKNQPYQAQAVTEIKQTLGNGSHISQTTTATVARDNEGRTVRIQKLVAIGPWTTASEGDKSTTITTIFDPVTSTHIDYTSDIKVAHVMPMPPLPPAAANTSTEAGHRLQGFAFGVGGDGPSSGQANIVIGGFVGARAISSQGNEGKDQKSEPLGTKTIEGIRCRRDTKSKSQMSFGNHVETNPRDMRIYDVQG